MKSYESHTHTSTQSLPAKSHNHYTSPLPLSLPPESVQFLRADLEFAGLGNVLDALERLEFLGGEWIVRSS